MRGSFQDVANLALVEDALRGAVVLPLVVDHGAQLSTLVLTRTELAGTQKRFAAFGRNLLHQSLRRQRNLIVVGRNNSRKPNCSRGNRRPGYRKTREQLGFRELFLPTTIR